MRIPTAAIRGMTSSGGEESLRRAVPLIVCVLLDTAAAGALLLAAPGPDLLAGVMAAALHLSGVLLLAAWPGPQTSRRWLCAASFLVLPWIGVAIAAAAWRTKGRGSAAIGPEPMAPERPAFTAAAARRLGDGLPPCDALLDGDDEERRVALAALSRRADQDGMAALRWAASGRDPDLALLAALTLDEIGERLERRLPDAAGAPEIRHAVR